MVCVGTPGYHMYTGWTRTSVLKKLIADGTTVKLCISFSILVESRYFKRNALFSLFLGIRANILTKALAPVCPSIMEGFASTLL